MSTIDFDRMREDARYSVEAAEALARTANSRAAAARLVQQLGIPLLESEQAVTMTVYRREGEPMHAVLLADSGIPDGVTAADFGADIAAIDDCLRNLTNRRTLEDGGGIGALLGGWNIPDGEVEFELTAIATTATTAPSGSPVLRLAAVGGTVELAFVTGW